MFINTLVGSAGHFFFEDSTSGELKNPFSPLQVKYFLSPLPLQILLRYSLSPPKMLALGKYKFCHHLSCKCKVNCGWKRLLMIKQKLTPDVYVLPSSGIRWKSGALIVRYRQKKESISSVFYCSENPSIARNLGATGPNEHFKQIENWTENVTCSSSDWFPLIASHMTCYFHYKSQIL